MIGSTVSHYRILESIGSGAMGVVFKAQDTRLRRVVALKFLPPDLTRDAVAKQRFVHEAETASALDHPNVCTIYDIDEADDGRVFIAMAYYEGETLRERIERAPLSIAEIESVSRQVALALQAAHHAGIVHRDVKPANIMVTTQQQVKLLDFGIAKLTGHADLTQTGSSVGTVAYMAPEQFEGSADARTDLWALGVVTYEMLTRRRPFGGADTPATMHAILNHVPESLLKIRPDISPALASFVTHALQKKPGDRLASAAAGIAALDRSAVRESQRSPSPFRSLLRPMIALPLLVVIGSLSYLLYSAWTAQSRTRWAREQALPEIARLSQIDEYHQAHALALQAQPYIPNDPALVELLEHITSPLPFVVPEAATVVVKVKPYETPAAEWQSLGSRALNATRLPKGAYRVRIEAEGFETQEFARNISDALAGQQPTPIVLNRSGTLPEGMVPVSGSLGPVELTGFATEAPVAVDDFAIDRFEVTNRQFKQFVDDGGYTRRELWKHPIEAGGLVLSHDEALVRFRDATGRPGPAAWELGEFPTGEANHPVTGISWYEASAYAEFRKASLPTIYHWTRAALAFTRTAPIRARVIQASHIGGKTGLLTVGSSGAIGPFGTFDMAGNAREWCVNASGANRWILGGTSTDDEHMFVVPYSLPPIDRSTSNGFRLVRYSDRERVVELSKPSLVIGRDFRLVKPVSDDVYAVYKRQLTALPSPPDPRIEGVFETDQWRRERISIDTGNGERMAVIVFVPKTGARHQAVVHVGGLTIFLNRLSSQDLTPELIPGNLDYLIKSGRMLVVPIWRGSYERHNGFATSTGERHAVLYRQHMRDWVQEASQVLDYLTGRPDVDPNGIGYLGQSFGAGTTLPLLAMEPRFRAAVLFLAGFSYQSLPPDIAAVNFASRITLPVLLQQGRYDHLFPVETSQRPLFNLLGTPADQKRMVLFDAGHGGLPRGQSIRNTLEWFDTYLGPSK